MAGVAGRSGQGTGGGGMTEQVTVSRRRRQRDSRRMG